MDYLYKLYRTDKKPGRRRLASNFWWACWDDHGRRMRESTECELDDRVGARKFLRGKVGAVDRDEPSRSVKLTLAAALQAVMDDKKLNGRSWLEEPQRSIDKHLLPGFGPKRRLSSIDVAAVRRYQAERSADGAANATINGEVRLLGRAFVLAHRAGQVYVLPRFQKLQEALPRSGFCDRPEFDAVVKRLPKWLQPALIALYILGWRRDEILNLAPHQVDLQANTITLEAHQSKNREKRVVSMPDGLHVIVKKQLADVKRLHKAGYPCKFVFHHPLGGRIGSFRKRWATACKRAGYPALLVHDFRRSAARNFIRAGVDEQTAMKFLGQKTNSMFRRYRIIDERDMQHAAQLVTAFFKKAKPKRGVVRQFPKRRAS